MNECVRHGRDLLWIEYPEHQDARHTVKMAAAAAVSELQLLEEHKKNSREPASCEILEDRDHMQGLHPTFASKADVILCADDGNTSLVGLPVHRDLISTYSPFMFQLVEAIRSDAAHDQQPLHLRLLKNTDTDSLYSSSAMRVAVSYLYPKSGGSQSSTLTLDMLPMHAECLHLIHKYGTEKLLMTLDKDLKEPLEQF